MATSHHVIHFLLFAVSGVILPQGSHQNHGHQAHQKNYHHERVEDGEPVNLGDKIHNWQINLKVYFNILQGIAMTGKTHKNINAITQGKQTRYF